MTQWPPVPIPPAGSGYCTNVVGVGIDLAKVSEVRDSIQRFGDRYLNKLFTLDEVDYCRLSADPAPRLAARFAAKEATIKALKVEGAQPAWTSMEVRRSPLGWCDEIRLTGKARTLADERGISRLLVSLSHEDNEAVAIVVATRDVAPSES